MPILDATDVFAGYGETEILHGVTMRVEAGELVAVIGPNGAGKSTLVKTIIGLLRPSRGRIVFDDHDITGMAPERLVLEGLAYVPQTNNTFQNLTVLENLEIGAITRRPGVLGQMNEALAHAVRFLSLRMTRRTAGGPEVGGRSARFTEEEFDARVEEICSLFPNLRSKLHVKVRTMSGGEQQMIALAKTLILDPRLLLIDEPSAGLAPRLVTMIFERIQEINRRGVAIVLVEQNARKALSMAHRGYVFEAGKNRYEGPGSSLLRDPDVGRLYLGG